jgi:hypothetical protein
LLARSLHVADIMSRTSTSFAKVNGDRVWYPPEE